MKKVAGQAGLRWFAPVGNSWRAGILPGFGLQFARLVWSVWTAGWQGRVCLEGMG